jgi:aspartate/methionine/tyrosine aminotransferase
MDIPPFELERWFDRFEHDADLMLAESGVRPLSVSRFDTEPSDLGYVIPTDGDPAFRAELAARYGRTVDELTFTCGAQEANFLAVRALMDAGDHSVVVTPTYQSLYTLPDRVGSATRVPLSPPDWTLDVDAVADAVRPDTSLLVVNNPNNPTGRYHDAAAMRALADVAADADAALLVDEVYRELAPDPHPPAASLGDHVYSTASLSKAYGLAGLRFGWFVGDEETVARANRWKDYTTISPGAFGQHLARQAMGEMEDEVLTESRDLAERNRTLVAEFLADHGLDWHDPVGVNGFPTIPDAFEDSEAFCRAVVEEASVVLAPGTVFGHSDRFRIGFGLPTEELRAGLDRVSGVIERRA